MILSVVNKTVLSTSQCEALRKGYGVQRFYDEDVISAELLLERIGTASVVVTNVGAKVTADILEQRPQVRSIIAASTGVDHIDVHACEARGVRVRSFPDYCAEALAEKALTFALMGLNRITPARHNVASGRWDYDGFQAVDATEAVIGIFGTGHSGKALARLAAALGMTVLTVNSRSSEGGIVNLLRSSDVISLHVPATPETMHMIDERRLGMMKESVSLINISRGTLIDEDALTGFLRRNPMATAFLDVLKREPPERQNPLLSLPNAVVTPHIAWNSILSERRLQESLYKAIKEEVARTQTQA